MQNLYSSSLTDKEWEIIEPLLPKKKQTRPPTWTKRQILDGILYQLKNGCNWRDMPRDLPPFSTVYRYYKEWKDTGVFTTMMDALHSMVREQSKKSQKWTTLIIIDSQAVKNTCNASIESKGFCSYKATNGIKRHLAVDTLGFPFFTYLTKANISDDQGLIEMLTLYIDYFKLKPEDIPIITILLDSGYHIEKLIQGLEKVYPEIMTKIKFEIAPKMSKEEKKEKGLSGFVVVPTRWVVERSNAWVERCKILVKNFERTLLNATAKLNLCFIRLMLKRVAIHEI
jgi:transposase